MVEVVRREGEQPTETALARTAERKATPSGVNERPIIRIPNLPPARCSGLGGIDDRIEVAAHRFEVARDGKLRDPIGVRRGFVAPARSRRA